jgi:hypothetical protein
VVRFIGGVGMVATGVVVGGGTTFVILGSRAFCDSGCGQGVSIWPFVLVGMLLVLRGAWLILSFVPVYLRLVLFLWVCVGVLALVLSFLYALPRGLCDTGTCPTDHWLAPVLYGLVGVGVVGTVFVWFLRRWNQEGPRDHEQ